MKTSATLLALVFGLTLSTAAFAAKPGKQFTATSKKEKENKKCLEVCARPVFQGDAVEGVKIGLYKANKLVLEISASEESKVFFSLDPNSIYAIKFSKSGYADRLISINTEIPNGVKMNPIFTFDFDIEMLSKDQPLDEFYIDFPVALVSFDKSKELFVYSKKYTRQISKLQEKYVDLTVN